MARPLPTDYAPSFARYIDQVQGDDPLTALKEQEPKIAVMLNSFTEENSNYAYAPGKWSIKMLWQHIIDGERIFCYRALCIARGETQGLPGFEEDDYAALSGADERSWESIVQEMKNVRRSTIELFQSFTPDMLARVGTSNGKSITPNALGFILAGHIMHHMEVIRERYLPGIKTGNS